jgi:TfoX/Sxy family transcriptional regulator of competence genes
MAYDEAIAERVRRALNGRRDITEKKMMGGLAFTIGGGMCCYLSRKGYFLLRVTPEVREQTLAMAHVKPTDFAGRQMSGFVIVQPEGLRTDTALARWLERGIANASAMTTTRPAKKAAPRKTAAKKPAAKKRATRSAGARR